MFLTAALSVICIVSTIEFPEEESAVSDTLDEAILISSMKQTLTLENVPASVTIVNEKEMMDRGVWTVKEFTGIVPNLYIPDYGSAMTSSIYLRGFGSRMDNPVMCLYVDDVPVMNKNAYDFDFNDMAGAVFLRGPQSTLYGRNSTSGVLSLTTLSPADFTGIRAAAEYGNANTLRLKVSSYFPSGIGVSAGYRHSNGFYYNEYNGRQSDKYDAFNATFRAYKKIRPDLIFEDILTFSLLSQGGYPYREYDPDTGKLHPVSYNDPCGYKRLYVNEAVKFKYMRPEFSLNAAASIQFIADRMILDQDFTSESIFTLKQTQKEPAFTCELILKPESKWEKRWWTWQTGLFGFFKYNDMSAPVRFKEAGIEEIILSNANKGIQFLMPGAKFDIEEDEFDIFSDLGISDSGAAIYHESYFTVGKWLFTAGLRLCYEGTGMTYDSNATIHYKFDAPGLANNSVYKEYKCPYGGNKSDGWFEFMPKVSIMYNPGKFKLFATVAEGYRAGGFNVQMFSDILQNMMMNGIMGRIMDDMGAHIGTKSDNVGAENTVYGPERSLNFEIGGRFDIKRKTFSLSGGLTLFNTECKDQQITVFPPGMHTGRMMANAGRSRSNGVEAELSLNTGGLSVAASYGYCHAFFVKYSDGNSDYSGKRIPYVPENTVNARVSYDWFVNRGTFRSIGAYVDCSAAGKIMWNEENTLSEHMVPLLGAGIKADFNRFSAYIRGENITDATYRTFYFKSVGQEFFQTGKPVRFTIGIKMEI